MENVKIKRELKILSFLFAYIIQKNYICKKIKMNCLKYLLQQRIEGHNFDIFYNGCHAIGVNNIDIFDYGGIFKREIKSGSKLLGNYLPIEQYHSKEKLKEMFSLTEEEASAL